MERKGTLTAFVLLFLIFVKKKFDIALGNIYIVSVSFCTYEMLQIFFKIWDAMKWIRGALVIFKKQVIKDAKIW